MAKIGDVCASKIDTLSAAYNGKIDYIDISAVDNREKKITQTAIVLAKDAPSRAKQLVEHGDVIVSLVRPNLNAVAIIEEQSQNLQVASTGYCVLRCNQMIYNRYLFYFCQSETFVNSMTAQATGASYPAVSNSIVKNCEIPLPERNKQKEIADILDKVTSLISLRKQQLVKLDELVKARFVEMFGDEQAFNKEPLSQNVEEMFIGPFGSSLKNESFVSKENGYCMVYEQKHAIRKTMDVETRYIDKPKYEELKRFSIHGGDIIVSCRGTIGETYIVPLNAPLGIMHPSIMKIRVKDSVYNRVFFDFLLQEKLKQHEAQANGSGVKMAVTASALGKEEFIVPSIPFQNQFAAFVERVNQQKQTVQQSLEKLELMKKALMQEYFG